MPDLGFDQWLPQIVGSYVQGRLGILQGSDEDAAQEIGEQLDNLEVISDEFESLPVRSTSSLSLFLSLSLPLSRVCVVFVGFCASHPTEEILWRRKR